jgi:hypothetical protein
MHTLIRAHTLHITQTHAPLKYQNLIIRYEISQETKRYWYIRFKEWYIIYHFSFMLGKVIISMLKLFETVKKIKSHFSKVIKAIKVLSVQCKMGKTANLPNLHKVLLSTYNFIPFSYILGHDWIDRFNSFILGHRS